MKIYFDLAKKCLKEVDTENQVIFTGDVLVSKLEVISSAPTTDYYVVVSAKLSNGRTIGPFLYDANGVQTDSHCTKWTFTLSSANGFTLTKGIVNFYVWLVPVNANDLNKKCIGAVAVNVGEAYGFEDSYFVELDSESSDVIANMSAQIHQLQTLIQNVNIIVPNPTDAATQILDKIKIGSVTYRFRSDYNELTNQPIKNVTLGANTTINDLLQAVDYDETLGELNTSYLLKIKGIFSSPYDSKYLVGMSVRYYNNAVQNVILSQVNGNVVYSGTWSASDFDHTIYNPTSSTTYTFNEFLKYTSQSLTDVQKQQAQANIGVKDVIDAVNYNVGTDVMRPQVDEVNFADVDEVRINAGKTMLINDDNEDEALLSSVLGGLDDGIADLESGKAKKIVATINNTTYVMTISLYADAEGTVLLSTATVDLPLESIVTSATYYDSYTYGGTTYTKVIVLVLSTTSVPTIVPVGDLISGLQTEITAQNKLSSDLVDDSRSSLHKFVTDDDKLVWNAKQNALTFDNVPTSGSNNPVKSGGIHSAIDSARQQATQDAVNILTSDNSFVQANLGATPVPDSIVELNGDLYSLWGVGQYKFNENTKQWETVSIPIGANVSFARADILGGRIFKIGNSYYCAFNDATKGVAYLTSQMHWVQGTSNVVFDGATVWTDGTDTYAFVGNVSNADDAIIYRIIESSPRNLTLTDVTSSFTNIPTSYGGHKIALTKANIWHDLSGNTFLSYGKTYNLIANSRTFDDREYFSGMSPSISQGNLVWNDGHNVFLTTGNTYVLNMTTETSTQLPIAGMESMNPSYGMYGNRIWKDLSGNVYYVDNSLHQFALVNGSFIDQAYDPTSKNAQSGISVAEAVAEEQERAIADNHKALYHKGAFDTETVVDGITTITRQTGYINKAECISQGTEYGIYSESGIKIVHLHIQGQLYSANDYVINFSGFTKTNVSIWGDMPNMSYNVYYDSNANETILAIRNNSISDSDAWALIETVKCEFKTTTSYTEQVITGQPLNTLDQKGSQWLREEWLKGLNLLSLDDQAQKTDSGLTYSISDGLITINGTSNAYPIFFKKEMLLKSGTYTISKSIDNTNLYLWVGINNEYNNLVNSSSQYANFTINNDTSVRFCLVSTQDATYNNVKLSLMLNEGNHAYPYQEYNGKILHQKDIEPTLLWQNGSPSSDFAEQTITTADMSKFKYIVVEYKYYYQNFGSQILKAKIEVNQNYQISCANVPYEFISRQFKISSNTSIIFSNVYKMDSTGTWGNASTTDQNLLVPVAIYGTNIL